MGSRRARHRLDFLAVRHTCHQRLMRTLNSAVLIKGCFVDFMFGKSFGKPAGKHHNPSGKFNNFLADLINLFGNKPAKQL